jgi:hypothetical protein
VPKVEMLKMNRKKFNQLQSKKLFLVVKKSVHGENCAFNMKISGILGTPNSRH